MRLLADQTPTPTRFLQNCEEVGLFKEIEEEFLQEQEEEKNKEVHIYKERYRHHFSFFTLCSDWPTPEWFPLLLWRRALLPGKHILPFQTFHVDLTHLRLKIQVHLQKKKKQRSQRLPPLPPTRFSPITGSPVWASTRTPSRSCTIPTRFPCSIRRATTAAWWARAAATARSMFCPPPWLGWSSPRPPPRSHTRGECTHQHTLRSI